MMLRSIGALTPFRIYDPVLELAQKHQIMFLKIARNDFALNIILSVGKTARQVYKESNMTGKKAAGAAFYLAAALMAAAFSVGCALQPGSAGNVETKKEDVMTWEFKATAVETEDQSMTVTEGTKREFTGKAAVTFSDGTKKEDAFVSWYDEGGERVLSTEKLGKGPHTLTGRISYFDNPVIEQRADPYVIYNEDDGCYYFTSSWPAYNDAEHGYDRIVLRKSPTLAGLRDAEDHIIWEAHPSGAQSHHIWAPELHEINGTWYIYYAATGSNDVWSIRPFVLMCSDPDDLLNPDKWTEKGRFLDKNGKEAGLFDVFSLDMTCFENKGKHYVIWAYKGYFPNAVPGSILLMAELDEDEPWKLSSDPVLLSEPEYDWEQVNEKVNEGPAVLKHNGRIYVTYSASATGPEYCMGLLSADEDADIMDAASWQKSDRPVLSSEDFSDQYGPGHNSFTTDEEGHTIIVYHSRDQRCYDGKCDWAEADPLYDPCRNANFAYVRFKEDGTPVFNSTEEKETAGLAPVITITVD